jgi:hypothetical protein
MANCNSTTIGDSNPIEGSNLNLLGAQTPPKSLIHRKFNRGDVAGNPGSKKIVQDEAAMKSLRLRQASHQRQPE